MSVSGRVNYRELTPLAQSDNRQPLGVFTIVDYPRASRTAIYGVNDRGQFVGFARIGNTTENFIGTPQ
jgi:hypothetical protein